MNLCLNCQKHTNNLKFCSRKCSAQHTNIGRPPRTEESKLKTSITLKKRNGKSLLETSKTNQYYQFLKTIVGIYTPIYLCECKISGIKWYSKTVKWIHPSMVETKKRYSYQCRFNFSLSKYSEYFKEAPELISQYGWYAASNRGNNLNGCSRDHLYSVSEGFKNSIDPKIISHPANCKIVPHKQNQEKRTKCAITLKDLMIKIEQFEKIYGEQ